MTVEEYLLGQRSEKVHKGVKKQGINTNFSYYFRKKKYFNIKCCWHGYPVYSKYLSGAVAK